MPPVAPPLSRLLSLGLPDGGWKTPESYTRVTETANTELGGATSFYACDNCNGWMDGR